MWDRYHSQHALYVAETMLADVRETTHSWLADKSTYDKVDTTGWMLQWKQPSIRIYESKDTEYKFMIVVTSRKRNYIRIEDYTKGGKE